MPLEFAHLLLPSQILGTPNTSTLPPHMLSIFLAPYVTLGIHKVVIWF